MDTTCSKFPASKHLSLSRSQTTDDMEAKFQTWSDSAKALLSDIRLKAERLRVTQQEQIEQERLAAEKLEKERAEAEAKRKAEEERERAEAEKTERLRREQAEAEERTCWERTEAAQEQSQQETDVPSLAFPTANDNITSSEDNSGMSSPSNCLEYDLSIC